MTANPFFVLVLGMGTVFFGLILLILLTYLMSCILKRMKKEDAAPAAVLPAQPAPVAEMPEFADRKRFDAVVAAAIATYIGTDIQGLRIRSVRRVSGADGDRGGFVAAVCAAVASTMGTDVTGLRVHSIRKL